MSETGLLKTFNITTQLSEGFLIMHTHMAHIFNSFMTETVII